MIVFLYYCFKSYMYVCFTLVLAFHAMIEYNKLDEITEFTRQSVP